MPHPSRLPSGGWCGVGREFRTGLPACIYSRDDKQAEPQWIVSVRLRFHDDLDRNTLYDFHEVTCCILRREQTEGRARIPMGKGVDKTHCGVNQGRHNNQKNQSSEYRFVRRYHTPFYFAGRYAVKLPPVIWCLCGFYECITKLLLTAGVSMRAITGGWHHTYSCQEITMPFY